MILEYKDWKRIYEASGADSDVISFLNITSKKIHGPLTTIDISIIDEEDFRKWLAFLNSRIPEFDILVAPESNQKRRSIQIKFPEKYLESIEKPENSILVVDVKYKLVNVLDACSEIIVNRVNYSTKIRVIEYALKPGYNESNARLIIMRELIESALNKKSINTQIQEIDETLEEIGMELAVGAGFYDPVKAKKILGEMISGFILAYDIQQNLFTKYIDLEVVEHDFKDTRDEADGLEERVNRLLSNDDLSQEDKEVILASIKQLIKLRKKPGRFKSIADISLSALITNLQSANSELINELIAHLSKK